MSRIYENLQHHMTLALSVLFFMTCPIASYADEQETQAVDQKQNTEIFSLSSLNEEEQKAAGLDKLSQDEKEKLQNIINAEIARKEHDKKKLIASSSDIIITDIMGDGKKIVLSNGRVFQALGHDTKKSAKWDAADKIAVEATKKRNVFKLKNTTKDDSIKAKELDNK